MPAATTAADITAAATTAAENAARRKNATALQQHVGELFFCANHRLILTENTTSLRKIEAPTFPAFPNGVWKENGAYGIEIAGLTVRAVSADADEAARLHARMERGGVSPLHVRDIVEDWFGMR